MEWMAGNSNEHVLSAPADLNSCTLGAVLEGLVSRVTVERTGKDGLHWMPRDAVKPMATSFV